MTEQQNLDRQLDMLEKYGVDYIYNEKMTGTKRNRPELEKLLERLTEGDTVVVESLSRLGRSTKDLIWLMETFNTKGVKLENFFYRLGYVEAYGTGLMKIADSYKNSSVKHKLEVTDHAFKITLPFRPEVMNELK